MHVIMITNVVQLGRGGCSTTTSMGAGYAHGNIHGILDGSAQI